MGLSRANLQTIASRTGRKVVAAWSDHDQGSMGTIVGVVMHHTGSSQATSSVAPTLRVVRDGRAGLRNALSTFYIDKVGTIYLISEKICWHAGVGDWRGITDGNGHFLGIEAESDGVHWTAATIDAYVALVAEICRFLGVDPDTWAIRHAAWADPPGRKIDFAGINEHDFRARVAARLNGTEEDDLDADDKKKLAEIHHALAAGSGIGDPRDDPADASKRTPHPVYFYVAWALYMGDRIRNVQIPRMEKMLTAQAAQIGALLATVTEMAKGGGLTAAQVQAAAQAGAAAALKELGDALADQPDAPADDPAA